MTADATRTAHSAHRRLLGRSALAAAIKLAGAGLAFAMFIALAWSMDALAFGQFSTAFAAASVVSFLTPMGQQSAVLRFWPQLIDADASSAHALLRRSSLLVAMASLAGGGVIVLSGAFVAATDWGPLVLPTALLAVALGWTEFTSAVFRARQRVLLALTPRDVAWRSAVLATAAGAAVAGGALTPAEGVWACGALLLLATLPQSVLLLRELALHRRARAETEPLAQHRAALGGLWGVTALVPTLNQAGTLLVATSVGPEAAGALFAAERMARLIEVVQEGINQGTAPSVSSASAAGGPRCRHSPGSLRSPARWRRWAP